MKFANPLAEIRRAFAGAAALACAALPLAGDTDYATLTPRAQILASPIPPSDPMPVLASTTVPWGWMDLCNQTPSECADDKKTDHPRLIHLDQQTWDTLKRVNLYWNDFIIPTTNLDRWGTELDHWNIVSRNCTGDRRGDCKIYALSKRYELEEMGFPTSALLMTIGFYGAEGHAVLTVRTDRGDYVLDNLTDEIKPWRVAKIDYIKRASPEDPNVWKRIVDVIPRLSEPRQDDGQIQPDLSAPLRPSIEPDREEETPRP